MKAGIRQHKNAFAVSISIFALLAGATIWSATLAQDRQQGQQAESQDGRPKQAGTRRSLPVQFRLEQPHRIELGSIVLPPDARVTSMIAGHVDIRSAGTPTDNRVILVPGLVTYKRLKISAALPVTGDALQWFDEIRDGSPNRQNVSIFILDSSRNEVQRFDLYEAFPAGFEIDIPTSQWHLTVAFERFEQG